jgi:hypothetical protein
MVTVFAPAVEKEAVCVVAPPGDHKKPVPLSVTAESVVLLPAQIATVGCGLMLAKGTGFTVTVFDAEAEQLL